MKRFITPDPLGIDGGVNVYMWANLNPLYFIDPYGLYADSFLSRAGDAIKAGAQAAYRYGTLSGQIDAYKDWHYSRNSENDQKLSGFYGRSDITMGEIEAVAPIYISQDEAVYHRQGIENHYNQKYTSETSGSYGRYELVVRPNPDGQTYTHINDPINMGTLNRGESKPSHVFKDVVPYYLFGNSADDPTSMWDRLTVPSLMGQQESVIRSRP